VRGEGRCQLLLLHASHSLHSCTQLRKQPECGLTCRPVLLVAFVFAVKPLSVLLWCQDVVL